MTTQERDEAVRDLTWLIKEYKGYLESKSVLSKNIGGRITKACERAITALQAFKCEDE